ncbi:MAG: hypothetical protein WAK50_05580 [Nitrososphaeraceae archaeon]
MTRLVSSSQVPLCDHCPGGITKMVQLIRTKVWVCPICSSTEYHTTPNQESELTDIEKEYEIRE